MKPLDCFAIGKTACRLGDRGVEILEHCLDMLEKADQLVPTNQAVTY
jgi:hypothetical protein